MSANNEQAPVYDSLQERVTAFNAKLLEWVIRRKVLVTLLLAGLVAIFAISQWYSIGINASSSLPYHVFLIDKRNKTIEKGAFISFRWHGGGPYGRGAGFTKQIRGVPGDLVTVHGREFFVNGESVGVAKERATTGQPLQLGRTGVVPEGEFYVYAPNPDSLDSRYAITGWIKQEAIIGRAIVIY